MTIIYHTKNVRSIHKLLISIIGCELVGLAGTPFTISSIPTWYAQLIKPPFSPPNWIFGPIWTMLYFLMGLSAYLIWKEDSKSKKVKVALYLFLLQLFFNFLWSFIFFGLHQPFLALIDIVALFVVIILTIIKFNNISNFAMYLLLPYALWVAFATLLNASIVILNK